MIRIMIRRFYMKKPRLYFFLSVFTIICGFLMYYFLKNENMLMHQWFGFLPRNGSIITFSHSSILTSFFRYNLPDGLWLLSGLLFLRAVWHEQPKTFLVYRWCFLCIAFLLEITQLFNGIAGTFDIFDVVTMGSIALLESIVHKVQLTRRQS